MSAPITSFSGNFRWLSNFYPSVVYLDGKQYPTVEHAFQAAKTDDEAARDEIRKSPRPGLAKKLGRRVRLKEDWEKVEVAEMDYLLRQKFSSPEMKKILLATGDRELIEGNYWGDTFWGVCRGKGENWLGRLHMNIRSDLG